MQPITRRELARHSALAAGLVGASGWLGWDCGDEATPAAGLAKCVSMGSVNNGGDAEDITAHGNLDLVLETGAPWRDPYDPGPRVIDAYVAEMMTTAQAVSEALGHPVRIAGPALSDRDGSDSRLMTRFTTLTPEILSRLDSLAFPGTPSFVWTHHNYTDVERGSRSPSGVERLRAQLRGRWRGRGGQGDPRIWLTEGGARLGSGLATDLRRQAALVRRSWRRMRAAPGIELWTNYLLYSDPTADSGLRESRESGGAPRPVWDEFGSLRA